MEKYERVIKLRLRIKWKDTGNGSTISFAYTLANDMIGKTFLGEILSVDLFTGHTDIRHKEVYEGDIWFGKDGLGDDIKGVIHYVEHWGRVIVGSNLTFTGGLAKMGYVIGNKYDNPDIVKLIQSEEDN